LDAPTTDSAGTADSLARPIAAQDLCAIRGIGPALEQTLYNVGIGTYAQLSALSDAQVAAIVRPKDWQQFGCETWNEQARQLAKQTGTEGAVWNGLIPDDLTCIRGIGEVFEQKLYEAGVCTFADLASVGLARLQAIIGAERWQAVDLDAWVSQAEAHLESEAQ